MKRFALLIAVAALCSGACYAQNPITADSPYQVRFATNLNIGDSTVNVMNTGAIGNAPFCVNVYAVHPENAQVESCCSCNVAPDQVIALSVTYDVLSHASSADGNSVGLKLLSTSAGTCNPSKANNQTLAPGLAAWVTTLHATNKASEYTATDTPFTPATLSGYEFNSLVTQCAALPNHGICQTCQPGAK